MVGLEPAVNGAHPTPYGPCKKCENYAVDGVCNWLIPIDASEAQCRACRLNHVAPDRSSDEGLALWAEVEHAKRRLIYTLDQLRLRLVPERDNPTSGLAFDIAQSFGGRRVLTGHADALVGTHLAEADPPTRERLHLAFDARHPTLLAHFRHEIGHYFWERLVRDGDKLALFRAHFGDETRDFAACLTEHRIAPRDSSWSAEFVTPDAGSHPLEDWAETFAHYLLMLDTLDTAREFGFGGTLAGPLSTEFGLPGATDFDQLVDEWRELAVALNAMSRSMGLPAPYPFPFSRAVREKLELVHRLVREARSAAVREQSTPPPTLDAPLDDESSRTRLAV